MSLGYCFFNSYVYVSAGPVPYVYLPFTGAVIGTGAGTFDRTWNIEVDPQQFVYVCGLYNTSANVYDRTGAVLGTLPTVTSDAAFACKFSNAGVLQYSLVIDSAGGDVGQSLAFDSTSNVYFTGYYSGTPNIIFRSNLNASTTLGTLPASSGNSVFSCKFSSTGTLLYSLVIDSAGSDVGYGTAVDSLLNVYISGTYNGTPNIIFRSNLNASTTLGNLPTSSGGAAFTTKFSNTGGLQYSLVVDAINNDTSWAIACDAFSNVYFGGQYNGSPNIIFRSNTNASTTLGTLPGTAGSDVSFATKCNDAGALQYSFVIDGTGSDIAYGLACDAFSNVYISGQYQGTPNIIFRSSANVSTTVGTLSASSGSFDGFVTKFNSVGALQYSYIVSGSANDGFWTVTCDTNSNVFIGGYYETTGSLFRRSNANVSVLMDTFPTVTGSVDAAFVSKFSSTGTYFFSITSDSSVNDVNFATGSDPYGNVYFGGQNQNGSLRDASTRQFLNYSIITPTQSNFPLDAVSTSALLSLTGTYSLRRVLTSYTGPVINLRRSADNVTVNVFSDRIGTLLLEDSTPVSTWLGASTGFITTWYDQSGNGRHATQNVTGSQPSLNITNLQVDFASPANSFLEIASPGCIPTSDGLYTCVLRHGTLSGASLGTFFGSGSTTNGVDFSYDIGSARYWSRWTIASVASDVASQTGTGANQTVTYRYTTAGGALASKEFWINGTQSTTQQTTGSSGTAKNTIASINYIGRGLAFGSATLNSSLSFISIFSTSLSNNDRILVENQIATINPLPTIPARISAYYVKTDPTGSTGIPQLGYYPNFARIINASTSSRVNGLACDSGSNVYASYTYNGTTPTIINQNSTTLGSLPTSTNQAGALTKFDSVGTVLFSRIIDSSGNDAGNAVAVDSTQSNVYLGTNIIGAVTVRDQTGTSIGTIPAPFVSGAALSKFSTSTGNYQYSVVLDASGGNDSCLAVSCDPFSNVYFGGFYATGTINVFYVNTSGTATRMGTFTGNNSGFLTKCDPNGNLLYTLIVNTGGGTVQATQGSTCDPTGNVYMIGYNFNASGTIVRVSNSNVSTTLGTIPTPANYASFAVKFNPTGDLLYSLYIDSAGADLGYAAACDAGSNLYVAGYYNGAPSIIFRSSANVSTTLGTLPTSTGDAAFLSKFSSTGTLLYSYTLDSAGTDSTYGASCDLYGNVYFTGEYTATPTLRYVSNSNVATSVITLPASSGAGAFMISISPSGNFNYARIIDVTTNADQGIAVACDPGGNVFMGGQYNGAPTIRDHLGTTISSLPTSSVARGFICEFLGSFTPAAENLTPTLSNVWYTTVPFLNTSLESRLVDTDTDTSGNVFFLSQRSATAPVLTSKNAVNIKTMPPTAAYATSLVKFTNKGRYEWDVYSTNFGNAGVGTDVMCSLTHENSNVYIGSQQTAASPVLFYSTSNVVVGSIPASGTVESVDCYIAKFDTTGAFQWKSYVQGAQNFFPSVAASPNDNAIYLAGSRGGVAQMNVFNTSNVSVATIPTASSLGAWLVKYDRAGTYQWRTHLDNATVINRGVIADAKSNVYLTGYFTGNTVANVYASTGSTPAAVITKTGTGNAVYVVKYLTDGAFSWYAFMNTGGGVAQQFGHGCDPQSNVYVSGFNTSSMDIFDRTNYSVARTTIASASGFLVKFSEDGFYQWYARAYSPTNVTFDKVGTDIDFDSGSNVYATFSFLTPSAGASSTIAIRDSLDTVNTVSVGVINTSFNMVVKFSSLGVFQWACPQTTVVQHRANSALSVYGSNVYVSGTKLTTATTLFDRNLTSVSTIPATSSNAAYIAHYLTDGSYAFSDFQTINQPIIIEYPPVAMTSASTAISGQPYGNGTYTSSATSTFVAGDTYRPFDKSSATGTNIWSNQTSNYTVNNGTWLGYPASGGGDFNTTGIARGEWVQITVPSPIVLSSYRLTGWDSAKAPFNWIVAGSNDGGSTWTSINSVSNTSWGSSLPTETKTFNVPILSAFGVFRIVITGVNTTSGGGNVQIAEWRLFTAN